MAKKRDGIPVVKMGREKDKPRPWFKRLKEKPAKRAAKGKVVKAKVKVRGKTKPTKRAKRARPVDTSQPPVGSTPPPMQDTRPAYKQPEQIPAVSAPEPAPAPAASAIGGAANKTLVQGSSCTWIGLLGDAPDNADKRPVCPYCGNGLMEVPGGETTMQLGFEAYELGAYLPTPTHTPRPHPGYVKFMEWMRTQQRCFPNIETAAIVYLDEMQVNVDPTL